MLPASHASGRPRVSFRPWFHISEVRMGLYFLMHALDMIQRVLLPQKAAAVSVVRILIRSISAVLTQHKTG